MSSLKSYTGNIILMACLFFMIYVKFCLNFWLIVLFILCYIQTRDNLFEEMLQEPEEIAMKRKRCRELLRAYQQAFKVGYS